MCHTSLQTSSPSLTALLKGTAPASSQAGVSVPRPQVSAGFVCCTVLKKKKKKKVNYSGKIFGSFKGKPKLYNCNLF